LLGLNSSTGWFDLAAPDRIVARADFHRPSRATGPRQQLRTSSSAASHLPKLIKSATYSQLVSRPSLTRLAAQVTSTEAALNDVRNWSNGSTRFHNCETESRSIGKLFCRSKPM
jgi:hypothetical protein